MRFAYSLLFLTIALQMMAANQTTTLSPIGSEDALPFSISIEQESYTMPVGLHSGAIAQNGEEWLLIAGRTNGLHGFGVNPFPPSQQNTTVYVVNLEKQTTYSRSLLDPSSGLAQAQIDQLSVTSPQYAQSGKTLYMCGGYGVDTESGLFNTKTTFTAIDIPKMIKWVKGSGTAAGAIRQTSNPWMQVTGGVMGLINKHLQGLLMFGQNFQGSYTPSSNGEYTKQVRAFQIIDTGKRLYVQQRPSETPNDNYRRRDLNIVPIVKNNQPAFIALSGVFTLTTGIWTVPVLIEADGSTTMEDPNSSKTFKQGMNNYASATASLYSKSTKDNYIIQLGGISYGYFSGSTFTTDSGIPFINQVTTIKFDSKKRYSQYHMNAEYPVILSTGTNPGNPLLFGAGAFFLNHQDVNQFPNQVINFDKLKGSTTIGYIIGGIMSTLPNTSSSSDSTASPYIFRLVVTPRN